MSAGYDSEANTRVKEERRRPAVSTEEVIRVVPGLIGPCGFSGAGGRSGGDKAGSAADRGGSYKAPSVK
jgi:hypothetical protein